MFALKSLLPRAHYEKPEDYCYLVSVKTAEDMHAWVKALTEARVRSPRLPVRIEQSG